MVCGVLRYNMAGTELPNLLMVALVFWQKNILHREIYSSLFLQVELLHACRKLLTSMRERDTQSTNQETIMTIYPFASLPSIPNTILAPSSLSVICSFILIRFIMSLKLCMDY